MKELKKISKPAISVYLIICLVLMLGSYFVGHSINKPTGYGRTGADDSDVINTLPANNTSFFAQNSTFLANEDANRFTEQNFNNAVSPIANTGACLGSTGAGLVMTPTSCVAYNAGYRSTDTGSITFPNTSTCWVGMDENTQGNNAGLVNFTRATGTHYLIDCIDSSQPTMTTDSQLLMQVTTSGGSVSAVQDLRAFVPFLNSEYHPRPLANFGVCTSSLEGMHGTQSDSSVACVAGVTAGSGGTTHCEIRCNGTNWVRTGL